LIYTDLPIDWQTEIEKTGFARLYFELVFDPDNRCTVLSGETGIERISPITNNLEMDINYERRPTLSDVTITLKDPWGELDPKNNKSPFYNGLSYLYVKSTSGTNSVQVTHNAEVVYRAGQVIKIRGPLDNADENTIIEQQLTVTQFVAGVTYDTISFTSNLSHNFAVGGLLFVNTFREEIEVRLRVAGTVAPITLFRGKMLREPEATKGFIKITCSDFKKDILDKELTGADSDATNKIKIVDSTGALIDSIEWNDLVWPTLDRTLMYPLKGCPLGKWEATFSTSTLYNLSGPNFDSLNSEKTIGFNARLTNANIKFSYFIFKDGAYVYCADQNSGKLLIIDTTTKTAPALTGSIDYGTSPFYGSVAKNGNYVFVPYVEADAGFIGMVQVFNVTTKAAPFLIDTKTAGSESVPANFFPYGCKLSGNYLYVVGHDAITVFNVGTPGDITFVSVFSGQGSPNYMAGLWDCYISGNYLYTCSSFDKRLVIINITNPAALSLTATLDLGVAGQNIVGAGNYVYITCVDGTLKSVDVSTPASPTIVDSFGAIGNPNYGGGYGLYLSGDYVYTTNQYYNSLAIINITDPTALELYESIQGQDEPIWLKSPGGVFIDSGYAYISVNGAFLIYKVSTTYTNKQGGDYLRILPSAWGGSPGGGDIATFWTGISWEATNPVQIIYELLTEYAELSTMLINSSSYFGEKTIGTLYERLDDGATTIKIAVSVPQLIKAGETLLVKNSILGDFPATVTTGNTVQTSYPPYIELEISAFNAGVAGSFAAGVAVTWEQRVALDTDFNFDEQYQYCADNSLLMSITFERKMSILQAIETIGAHFDGFPFSDNWGVENIFAFKANAATAIDVTADTNLLLPDPKFDNKEFKNELILSYGFDYSNNRYNFTKTYAGIDGKNKGYWRYGTKITCDLILPGYYTEALADWVGANKTKVWANGVRLLSFAMNLEGLVIQIGDKVNIVSDYPAIDKDFVVIGKSYEINNGLTCKFLAYDITGVWT
jgi:hypothetical protein